MSVQAPQAPFEKLTVFPARKIITMCDAMPTAEAVAVANRKIVSVGTLDSLKPWLDRYPHEIDDRLADKILMPGLIDPHIHPSLPAVLTQFPFIAPDDWALPTGNFPGATTPEAYVARLQELVTAHPDWSIPFIAWGYHPLWHGDQYRPQLNALFPDKPVMLWHRSFHELICNDAALNWLKVTEAEVKGHPEINWDKGHFWENGAQVLLVKLGGLLFAPERYGQGMRNFLQMLQQAGVTTCLDMGIGIFGDPVGETKLIRDTAESAEAPCRIILTPIITDFLARKLTKEEALEAVKAWEKANSRRVIFDNHFKIMMDGAIFGGLSQYGFPGYMDGHAGMWMAPPEVTLAWAEAFWKAGFQVHAHTNGDLSADLLIDFLRHLLAVHPRFDHRLVLEHFAFTTEEQNRQLTALGGLVSANPYYHYILSDIFSDQWLGADRGAEMVRLGSLERLGVPFALHSDCPMGPLSPLTLAWCACNRVTINGNLNCPEERVSLHKALRAITIDAAWIMHRENEIGSIRAGKMADFAVLEADPYEVGAEGLKDIPIWGVVFEGELHPVKP
jgi:predicted amidohydrolase YtcJ